MARPRKQQLEDWQRPLVGRSNFMFVDLDGNIWKKPNDIFRFEPWPPDPNPQPIIRRRTDENLEDLYSAEAPVIAAHDIEDVLSANCLILFSDPPRSTNSRSGKEVEFGIGLGTERHRLILCGPRSNIFHAYDGVEDYPTFAALDAQLTRERDERRDFLKRPA